MTNHVILEPHSIGEQWWVDVRSIRADLTLGGILYSTPILRTREAALGEARAWVEMQRRPAA